MREMRMFGPMGESGRGASYDDALCRWRRKDTTILIDARQDQTYGGGHGHSLKPGRIE